jgi:hypothetical protein
MLPLLLLLLLLPLLLLPLLLLLVLLVPLLLLLLLPGITAAAAPYTLPWTSCFIFSRYSGCCQFESRTGNRLSWLTFFAVFFIILRQVQTWYCKIVHDFPSTLFNPNIRRCTVYAFENSSQITHESFTVPLNITMVQSQSSVTLYGGD